MKALIKPVKFQLISSSIYGYEQGGTPDIFHFEVYRDSDGDVHIVSYTDCVASYHTYCEQGCWWITDNGNIVHRDCD